MRYVYILRSNSCPWRHYMGVTLDPDRRLIAHNAGMSPHTSKYRPWSIIVVIRFEDDARAFGFYCNDSSMELQRFREPPQIPLPPSMSSPSAFVITPEGGRG
jgi:putative endonuclease